MLIDTHAHVNFNAFKDDADEVIRRCLDSNVWIINVGSQNTTSERAVKIAEKYEKGVYAAIGLHPIHLWESYHDFSELSFKTRAEEFDYDFYKKLAASKKVVAIGEIGLDYFHLPPENDKESVLEKQKEILIKQIELAQELDLPIIFHCRDAYDDLLKIIRDLPKVPQAVLHCFTDTYETAKKFLDLDFMISFTGIITYPKAERVREVVKKIPLERIMIETDCPYLAPQPVRGKRNEPIYVKYVAEEIARARGLSLEEVAKATTENAVRFFNL